MSPSSPQHDLAPLLETAPIGLVTLNAEGQVVSANPEAARVLGVAEHELLGRALDSAALGLGQAWTDAVRASLEAGGAPCAFEDARRHAVLAIRALAAGASRSEGLVVVVQDVSPDRVDRERAALAAADAANRAKDELLATVSHELRTPLNAILGWAQLLRLGPQVSGADQAQALETIERNSVLMAQLIDDLLDVSRIVSGKMRLEVQPVALVTVVEQALESQRPAAVARSITLEAELDRALEPVLGDPGRLQQVVWNLLSNAVKFTAEGGRVEVKLRRRGNSAEICVHDTGVGMDAAFLSRVFEPFTQADRSFKRTRGGLGIGLAIARRLVEAHGGTIHAESEGPGQGSTFTVQLPLMADRVRATATDLPPDRSVSLVSLDNPPQLGGLRVLTVEDDADCRDLLRSVLERCDATVITASSAAEAMQAFHEAVPDVLISDIGMPGEDGIDLIRKVRALPPERGGQIPAAALTAYSRAADRRQIIDAGYNMHVPKPVEPAELLAVVLTLTRFTRRGRDSSA